jgi:hypothetical protein
MERSAFEFHIARAARDRYRFDDRLCSLTAHVVVVDLAASRDLAHQMNTVRDADRYPDRVVHPGALNAMGILDEVTHLVLALFCERRDPRGMLDALSWLKTRIGRDALETTLLAFADQFPTTAVYRGVEAASDWLPGETTGIPHRAIALEKLITVWLANLNPALRPFRELFDDGPLAGGTAYGTIGAALHDYFESRPRFGPAEQNIVDMLRAPALASPDSLEGQLEYIRRHWADLLGNSLRRLLLAMDLLKEEEVAIWLRFHPPGSPRPGAGAPRVETAAAIPSYAGQDTETERFSQDEDWRRAPSSSRRARTSGSISSRRLRPRDHPPGPDPRRGARNTRAARVQRVVADRTLGAQWRVAAHQAPVRHREGLKCGSVHT